MIMASTQIDLSYATGLGPFDITGLGLIPNNRIPWRNQILVKQDDTEIATNLYSINPQLGTITFVSDVDGLNTYVDRDTPSTLAVQFTDGARVPAADLNDAFKQLGNEVDELRTDPLAGITLDDLADVGAPGDVPVDNDILLFDGTDWVFVDRGSINAVTAENVSVDFNDSDAEVTLETHDSEIDALEDKTQDMTHVGATTKVSQNVDVGGNLTVDGSISFGSLASDLNVGGTIDASQFNASTTNGLAGLQITNTGTGSTGTYSIDWADASGYVSHRVGNNRGFSWYTDSSSLGLSMDAAHTTNVYSSNTINDYIQIKPNLIGGASYVFKVVDDATAIAGIDGTGRVYGLSDVSGGVSRLRGYTDNDERYNKRPPNDMRQWSGLYDDNLDGAGLAPPYLPICRSPLSVVANSGDTNNGLYYGAAIGDFTSNLNSSTRIYNFQYMLLYQDNGFVNRYITRLGTGDGNYLYDFMNSDRNGLSYGGAGQMPSRNRYTINVMYQIISNAI